MSSDSDDDTPRLSAHALSALHEFLAEQQQEQSENKVEKAAKVGGIQEDWVGSFFISFGRCYGKLYHAQERR